MDEKPLKIFLTKYPEFSQIISQKNIFSGNLKIKENYFHVRFYAPNFPKAIDVSGYITKGLDTFEFPKPNDDSLSIDEFLNLLQKYLQEIVDSKYSTTLIEEKYLRNFDISEQLKKLKEYSCKILINKQETVIRFSDFEKYPGHQLDLNIESKNNFQIISHTLPDCTNTNEIFRHTNTLETFLIQFLQILEKLEDFYDNLHTIDELCYVVEPSNITLKHNWRIFKLNDKIFIKITIDPLQSSSVEVNLIGPTHEIQIYREMYNEKVKNWDIDLNVYKNLLRIFNLMYFPMKEEQENEENNEKYCNICYMYRLDNHIPIISCDNSKCFLIFHEYCLKEWFSTLMDEKTFLNVNLGICPFCKEKLSTSFVQLLDLK